MSRDTCRIWAGMTGSDALKPCLKLQCARLDCASEMADSFRDISRNNQEKNLKERPKTEQPRLICNWYYLVLLRLLPSLRRSDAGNLTSVSDPNCKAT
ncbi:hypothetical protein BASA60_010335 [Batrachochytrium salamandrivorans]|nr:hypothetical protein BASA60_010335 [Batrachochytrium salamandrivorans]